MAEMALRPKKIQDIAIFSKHFYAADIHRDPGGTRHSLIKRNRPKLHSWNTFGGELGKS